MIRLIVGVIVLLLPFSLFGQRKLGLGDNASSGYYNLSEVNIGKGLGVSQSDFSRSAVGFTTINGYTVDQNFRTGIGVGYYAYNGGGLIPLFADLRYFFRSSPLNYKQIKSGQTKAAFFLYADGGYLLNSQDFMHGTRMMLNPGLGFMKPITELFSLSFSVGIMTQMGDGVPKSSFLNTKLGLHFK